MSSNSVEKTNNGENNSINIQKSLNLKTSNVLPFLTTKPPNTCLSETALRNGFCTIIFLDLMSLEVCHTYAQMKDIKSYDKLFKPGWLHDEIIHSFLFNLTKNIQRCFFCGSTEAMLIHHAVCNFQSMKSPVELNDLLSKFFCYITWFVISSD